MATLTVSSTSRTGLAMTGATPGGSGDQWANTGVELLYVKNGSGSDITVTFDFIPTVDGNAVTDPAPTVTAGTTKIFGPFAPAYYTDSSTGLAKATCSATSSVTVAVFKLGST